MEIVSRQASEKLGHIIRELYFFETGPETGAHARPILDDCCYDLIFYKEGGAACLIYGEAEQKVQMPRVFTIHSLSPPYRFHFNGRLTFLTLKVQPWANASFFGPLTSPGVINMEAIRPEYRQWHAHLLAERSPEERFESLESLVGGSHWELPPEALWIRDVCQYIYQEKGVVSVQDLSQRFGVSRQHLGKAFKRQVLYPVKHFCLTVRMLECVKTRIRNPEASLTELAHAFGYFDQPHFIRDFRKFSGMPPSAFFRNLPEFLLRH